MSNVKPGSVHQFKKRGSFGAVLSTHEVTVTGVRKTGRGHTVTFQKEGEERRLPLGKFEKAVA